MGSVFFRSRPQPPKNPSHIENMIFIGDSRFRAPHESPFEHLTASRSTKSLSNVCVMNSFFLWRCFVTSRSDACYFAMARRVVAEEHVFGKIAAELVSDLCFCVHDCLWNLPRNSLTLRVAKDNHCESSTNRERTCGIGRKHIGTRSSGVVRDEEAGTNINEK